jgi:hypothetical protein
VRVVPTNNCPVAHGQPSAYGILSDEYHVRLTGPADVAGVVQHYAAGSGSQYRGAYVTPRVGTYELTLSLLSAGGLSGAYFNNRWLHGDPEFERVDASVDFEWPDLITADAADHVSIRWTGYIEAPHAGELQFVFAANDGVKMWWDSAVVIDQFDLDTPASASSTTHLATPVVVESGKKYPVQIEFRENTGTAQAKLMWQSDIIQREVVPTARLFHSAVALGESPFEVVF